MAKKDNSKVNTYKLVVDQVLVNGDTDTVSFKVDNKKPCDKDRKIFENKMKKFIKTDEDTQYYHIRGLILGERDNKKVETYDDMSRAVDVFFNMSMN